MQACMSLMQALIPALLMNICIVGLNQIFDVPIDRVNKPYLPLASGEFSARTGTSLVSFVRMFAKAGLSFQHCGAAALVYACSTISSPDNFVAIPF